MAVTAIPKTSSIILYVENGMAPDGSATYATRTIGRIDPALTDEKAYNFASAVGSLQGYPVGDYERVQRSVLTMS